MRHFAGHRTLRRVQRNQRVFDQSLMSNVGEEAGFRLGSRISANVPQNLGAQFGDAFPTDS